MYVLFLHEKSNVHRFPAYSPDAIYTIYIIFTPASVPLCHLCNLGFRVLDQIRMLAAGMVTRRQGQPLNHTVRDVLDFGDMLDVVVGITDAPQNPEAEREGYQEHEP